MKKAWMKPMIESLDLTETMNDLIEGGVEDHMSYLNGFPAYHCDCS